MTKDLPWLAPSLIVCSLAGALYFWRRAPAVALGLLGGVLGGIVGYRSAHGVSVPAYVAGRAFWGMLVVGIAGAFIPPRASPRYLWRGTVLSVPFGMLAVSLTFVVMRAWTCTDYDPATRAWCAGVDLFMGISGVVTFCVGVCALALFGLFVVSASRAEVVETAAWWASAQGP